MEARRQYSNNGPIVRQFESRLAEMFSVAPENVVAVGTGTQALMLSIMAQGARRGSKCLVPGWTHVATANAIYEAGLIPTFADVNDRSWSLTPASAVDLNEIEHIVTVAPFGTALDLSIWSEFIQSGGIKLSVDAATGFDAVSQGAMLDQSGTPIAISFHATKSFGIGEGGCVVTADPELAKQIRAIANNGHDGNGGYVGPSTNAKLSEIQAAIGLANLDDWPERREAWIERARVYRRLLKDVAGIEPYSASDNPFANSTFCVRTDVDADRLINRLAVHGIEARKPWGEGAYKMVSGISGEGSALPVTEGLSESVICLPFYVDLPKRDINFITNILIEEHAAEREQQSSTSVPIGGA